MKIPIQETRDYDKFTFQQANRGITNGHIAKLTVSITQRNLLAHYPILVNDKFEIIDGQHRYTVAKNNGFTLYYTVLKDAGMHETAMLNATTKPWNLKNFMDMYAAQGKGAYIWLRKMYDEYGISPSSALSLADTQVDGMRISYIKHGGLELTSSQKKHAAEGAEVVNYLASRAKRRLSRDYFREISRMITADKKDVLIEALQNSDKEMDGRWVNPVLRNFFTQLIGKYVEEKK